MHASPRPRGATLVETAAALVVTVVVMAITAIAAQPVQHDAALVASISNLRNLAVAGMTYAAEWNDRQLTLVDDRFATYGNTPAAAVAGYLRANGKPHPSISLGFDAQNELRTIDVTDPAHAALLMPMTFDEQPFGWSRMLNAAQFAQYLNGRFYDPIYYAPGDEAPMAAARPMFDTPAPYADAPGGTHLWSSYCWSAANLFSPAVFKKTGFTDPFSIPSGFRAPSYSQTLYPNLKTSMMEHHWIRGRPEWAPRCNAAVPEGRYDGCEPHLFNHYAYSRPAAAMMDGSVRTVLVDDAMHDDARVKLQSGGSDTLWHRNPGGAANGYYEDQALDPTRAAFHVFTVDGIRGRDVLSLPTRATERDRRREWAELGAGIELMKRQITVLERQLQRLREVEPGSGGR